MSGEIDAVVAGLKQDARRALADRRKKRRRRIPENEQIVRFLSGAERQRVVAGEITPAQYHEYEKAMLDKLAGMGALEVG